MKAPTQSHRCRGARPSTCRVESRRQGDGAFFELSELETNVLLGASKRPISKTGDIMTFREPDRDSRGATTEVAPTALMPEDEVEEPTAALIEEEPEETPARVPEESLTSFSSKGEDPVRLYLKEIGKVPLLTARQEVEIGRRIEVGQIALRRALAGIPMAVRTLLDVGDRLRREEIPADDVIVLPEGGELEPKAVRPVLLAFARMRRAERKIARLYEGLHDKRRSAASRQRSLGAVEAERAAIQQ